MAVKMTPEQQNQIDTLGINVFFSGPAKCKDGRWFLADGIEVPEHIVTPFIQAWLERVEDMDNR